MGFLRRKFNEGISSGLRSEHSRLLDSVLGSDSDSALVWLAHENIRALRPFAGGNQSFSENGSGQEESIMPICGHCGKECRVRFIDFEAKEKAWLCADCMGLSQTDPFRTTAEKIAKAEADGTLDKYKLSERLENLKGRRVQ
jgi:hypothetical protein